MSPAVQDQVLGWLSGRAMAAAPMLLHLSLHTAGPVGPQNEVSDEFGGRLSLPVSQLGPPQMGESGLREITNTQPLLSQPGGRTVQLESFGLWTRPVEGFLLLDGVLTPGMRIAAGGRVEFGPGRLILRATA